jgi:outer membrane PBP1 activator LpoA protein
MFFETRQWSIVLMLSLCSAVTLFAEQRVRVEDVARLQAQAEMERQELQIQMERVQRENRHVVKAPAVNALELRRAEAQAEKALQVPSGKNNPRSPEETAKVQVALQEFNEQLPELNRALKQASSNSAVPMIVLSPMTAEGVFSAAEKEEVPGES